MNQSEFSNQFDVLYNNITSNQAPGLNEYEKSLFLTKAQDELLKNYFLPQSNPKQAGFDGNQKRQMDFSKLMRVANLKSVTEKDKGSSRIIYNMIDPRSMLFEMPLDSFLIINESVHLQEVSGTTHSTTTIHGIRQVKSLSYDEYMRLMSKPYKNPVKNEAWRLLTNSTDLKGDTEAGKPYFGSNGAGAELILTNTDRNWLSTTLQAGSRYCIYSVRYIRRPMPIILTDISDMGDDLTIGGYNGSSDNDTKPSSTFYANGRCCELDDSLHEEILQRAVELAKVAWTASGNDNAQMVLQAGQRSE